MRCQVVKTETWHAESVLWAIFDFRRLPHNAREITQNLKSLKSH